MQNVEFNQRGLPHHLLTGHGMQLGQFEKRDMATTKNLSYDLKQTAKEIINPTTYAEGNTTVSKL